MNETKIVIAIASMILTAIFMPSYFSDTSRVYMAIIKHDTNIIDKAIENYKATHNELPLSYESMIKENGGSLAKWPSDPWRNPYVYKIVNGAPAIYSKGLNSLDDSNRIDDIDQHAANLDCETHGVNCNQSEYRMYIVAMAVLTMMFIVFNFVIYAIKSMITFIVRRQRNL